LDGQLVLGGDFQPLSRSAGVALYRVIFNGSVVRLPSLPGKSFRTASVIEKAIDRNFSQPGVKARFVSERWQS
jgi:hypothetical protein